MKNNDLPSWNEHFLNEMRRSKNESIKAAETCRIEDAIKHAQLAAMITSYITHPGVTLTGANKIKDEFDNMKGEIANALRKGCRL